MPANSNGLDTWLFTNGQTIVNNHRFQERYRGQKVKVVVWLIGEGSDLVSDLPQNLLICLFQHCLLEDTATMLEYVHRPEKRVVAR